MTLTTGPSSSRDSSACLNRVISDKPSGLVVDYIGIGCELKQALKVGTSIKSIENLSKKHP
jgi:type I site-specific restriction-modification system R (restriction) subunit